VFDASYGKGSDYSQASVGVTGAIVAHSGGVTFGQPTGDTIGVVYAPGAAGAQLQSAPGARIDHFGYAIVPYLTPYNLNTVQIDPKGLPLDVQLDATSAQVAPYEGAVVMLKFKTENGRALIVHATLENGEALPFGAEVFNEKGAPLGVVGQGGQILVRGVNQSGQLSVRWQNDDGATQSCSFTYQLAPRSKGKKASVYDEIQATCARADAVAQNTRSGP
jgi:outer membrane usher protein